jgi:hypothetical protein
VKGAATVSGVTGTFGTITRSGGSVQATFDGHPPYDTAERHDQAGNGKGRGAGRAEARRTAGAAGRALARALDLGEPDRVLSPFLIHPPPGLHDCHARHHISDAALTHGETRVLHYLPANVSAREIADELYGRSAASPEKVAA